MGWMGKDDTLDLGIPEGGQDAWGKRTSVLGTWALRSLWVFLQPAGDLERGVGGPRVGSPGAGVLCGQSGKG